MDFIRAAVAVVVLALFVAALGFLVSRIDAQDTSWSRFMYLYNGLEAIVFAAIGWLFGREVHRAQAQAAEQRASAAEQRATEAGTESATAKLEAKESAVKAHSLVHAIHATAQGAGAAGSRAERMGPQPSGAGQANGTDPMGYLARLADSMFPTEPPGEAPQPADAEPRTG